MGLNKYNILKLSTSVTVSSKHPVYKNFMSNSCVYWDSKGQWVLAWKWRNISEAGPFRYFFRVERVSGYIGIRA